MTSCACCLYRRAELSEAARVASVLDNLGAALAETRIQRGVSQREVSRQTGISFSTVSRIERGVTANTNVRSALTLIGWIEDPTQFAPATLPEDPGGHAPTL